MRSRRSGAAPRLVATDLDGTLLRSDGSLSPRSVAAVTTCEDAGAVVVLATGRPPRWIHHIGDELSHRGVAVCLNGAIVYDLAAQDVVSAATIQLDAAREVVARLRRWWPGALFAVETLDHLGLEPGWKVSFEPPAGTRFADAFDLVSVPAAKILARLDGEPTEADMAQAAAQLADVVEVTWSGGRGLLEMSAPGVTKAVALEGLAARLGLDASAAVAFGDMPNDVEMLRWAGWGLAVANAHEAVQAAADEIIGSNDDDGVAQALEAMFS